MDNYVITFRMPRELAETLKAQAQAEGRSLNNYMVQQLKSAKTSKRLPAKPSGACIPITKG